MADNETIADIIAEKRRQADKIERVCAEKMKHSKMVSDCARELVADIRREADRLEAAHRRERAKIEADALTVGGIVEAERKRERGDCAKLREALEHLLHGEYRDRCEVTNIAHAALSAPPRNCDLARDWMRDLYAHFQPPASIKREMPPEWVDAVMAFCRWLVAPATEKEGGNK